MRPEWPTLPLSVIDGVESVLGFAVVSSTSVQVGFSPGVAAVVAGSAGQLAFVKAVSSEVSEFSAGAHRDEARFAALLPSGPRLLGVYDDGTWVALAFEEVSGRTPHVPWVAADLEAAIDVLDRQASVVAPPSLPTIRLALRDDLDGFAQLSAAPAGLSGWELRHVDALASLEADWLDAATGDRWLHNDARGDNMLILADGSAVLVDWPWSSAGNPAFDAIGFVPAAIRDGAGAHDLDVGARAEELFQRFAASRMASSAEVDAMVCAFAGYMQRQRRQPGLPALPGIREFQGSQGDVAMAWLQHRLGWV